MSLRDEIVKPYYLFHWNLICTSLSPCSLNTRIREGWIDRGCQEREIRKHRIWRFLSVFKIFGVFKRLNSKIICPDSAEIHCAGHHVHQTLDPTGLRWLGLDRLPFHLSMEMILKKWLFTVSSSWLGFEMILEGHHWADLRFWMHLHVCVLFKF